MFNIRPGKRWFEFDVEPPEDLPGFRMNADRTIGEASPADLSTAFDGRGPGNGMAVPGGTTFDTDPNQYVPGLHNFKPSEDFPPGLHNFKPPEDLLPGFRMNTDGTVGDASPAALSGGPVGIGLGGGTGAADSTASEAYPEQSVPGLHNYRPPEDSPPGFRMDTGGSIRDASSLAAPFHSSVGASPFGVFDPLGANGLSPIGDGSPPLYLLYGSGPFDELGRVPILDGGGAGGAVVPPPPNVSFPAGSDGRGPFVPTSFSFPFGQPDPSDRLRPPTVSYGQTTNPPSMPGSSFAAPIPDEGFQTDQPDAVAPSMPPATDGAADPNIVRVADGDEAAAGDDVEIAQAPAARPSATLPSATQRPGRGYGTIPQRQIERGMNKVQRQINRDQAFRELTRQPLTAEEARNALPDDWETSKPAAVVDGIKRSAERFGLPVQLFARQMYQEGKFGEAGKLGKPLLTKSDNPDIPLGYAQMTQRTVDELKRLAILRGDSSRVQELSRYSAADRAQSFDAAAEQLAYLYRLSGGSWPRAVAAYNVGKTSIQNWFDGEEGQEGLKGNPQDPMYFAATGVGKDGKWLPTNKWTKEVPEYLRQIFRGSPEDFIGADMYAVEPPNRYQARRPIPPRVPMPAGQPTAPGRRPQ